MRVPIEGGRGIGYILRPGFDLPPLMFSIEEMEAIVLALALLERTGDVELKQAAKRVNQKIAGAVPPPLRQTLEAKRAARLGNDRADRPKAIDLALVRRAIRDEEKLRTRLSRRSRPGDANGTIRPIALIYYSRDRQHRRLVRIAPGDPQLPHRSGAEQRPRRGLLPQ